ncbi:MAG: DUF2339 domain-containing protein [Verrucomicrobiae bacterium]|nr:DUF2339 domain-containing protein [Verrucomicrobiae bacterium]
MEMFIVLLLIVLFIWLGIHSSSSNERIRELEASQRSLREQLQRLQQQQTTTPAPPEPEVSQPTEAPKPEEALPPELPETPPSKAAAFAAKSAKPTPPRPVAETPATPPPLPPHRAPRPAQQPRPQAQLAKTFEWRPLLEKVKLWPPTGENAEATIAAWWLSRIGLIVLIIGAVFFGVRIAENTPPWLRLATLAGISTGVALLGLWLEKRLTIFGRLISAGGLGLGFFTAFAAYGVPATKIIDSAATGFFIQGLAVLAVVGWSLWKKDEAIAAMAVLLGYVASWFSYAHDLHHYVIASLLVLAIGAGVMVRLQRWLWPYGFAVAGSWIGFLILGVAEWSREGRAPDFPIILVSLTLLTVVLEAANFLAQENNKADEKAPVSKWLRWLAVINTSLAICVSWLAIRLAFPVPVELRQLDTFYLVFAFVMLGFTALRYWRRHPVGVTETYFLKASGLFALFIVAWFDGPTRWLSLSVQTLILLWAWRRSHLLWIEVGFGVLFVATLGVIAHDLNDNAPVAAADWSFFTMRHLVGIASLTILSAGLALHARWKPARPLSGPNNLTQEIDLTTFLRALAGLACGALLVFLILIEISDSFGAAPVVLLSIGAIILSIPAFIWRRVPPVIAGLTTLVATYLFFLNFGFPAKHTTPALWTGAWLALLGFGLAEVAAHLWRGKWPLGNGVRLILHGFALATLATTLGRSFDSGIDPAYAVRVLATLGLALAIVWALIRQGRPYPAKHLSENVETHRATQWVLAGIGGIILQLFGWRFLAGSPYAPSYLALAAGIVFAAAWFTRNAVPALAGGLPLIVAVAEHILNFGTKSPITEHLFAALLIVAVCAATAIALWKSVDATRFRSAVWFDGILHLFSLLVVHWFLRSHMAISEAFAADAAVALALAFLSRRFSLPSLGAVSAFPLMLGLLRIATSNFDSPDPGAQWLWWLAAVLVLGWLWFSHHHFLENNSQAMAADTRRGYFAAHGAVAAIALSAAGYFALDTPWHLVSLGLFALAAAALGLFGKLPLISEWSMAPLVTGIVFAISLLTAPPASSGYELFAISGLGFLIAGHGVLLTRGSSGKYHRSLSWLHGLTILVIVFPAFANDKLGVESLTTVCWGIAAICLFAIGLVAGLRPYRLAGLIGLALAMVRMFVVDIDDSLYRIYAFFVIAAVLLGVGYLYHRFRYLIERADGPSPTEKPV